MKENREVKRENGITLIALVITIIVLLILAGVSILALGGQNGILTNATETKEDSEIGDVKDGARIGINEKQMEKLSPDINEEEYYESTSSENENMYGAAGLRYNFGKIKFTQGTEANVNEGIYIEVNGKTSGNLSETEFLVEGAEEVHNLTLAELNEARGETDLESINSIDVNSGGEGLFYLRGLNKYGYTINNTPYYWLAAPASTTEYSLRRVGYTGNIENISSYTNGVRPVVSLPSNFRIEETDG